MRGWKIKGKHDGVFCFQRKVILVEGNSTETHLLASSAAAADVPSPSPPPPQPAPRLPPSSSLHLASCPLDFIGEVSLVEGI